MGRALDQTNPELALKIWNGGSRLSGIASENSLPGKNDQRVEISHDYPVSENLISNFDI